MMPKVELRIINETLDHVQMTQSARQWLLARKAYVVAVISSKPTGGQP